MCVREKSHRDKVNPCTVNSVESFLVSHSTVRVNSSFSLVTRGKLLFKLTVVYLARQWRQNFLVD